MTVLAFDAAGYRNMLRMSSQKRILVEGRSDKILLKTLLMEMFGKNHGVQIDTAENLSFGYRVGNREKVEIICNSVQDTSHGERLVGFVDREFRDFDLSNGITDLLNRHKVIGRLIWSRGHSVENYYFDFDILRSPLRTFSVTPYFDSALDLFEVQLNRIIAIACATGLAGRDVGLLNPIKSSFDWQVFDFDKGKISLNLVEWQKNLMRQKLSPDIVNTIITNFSTWIRKISSTDPNTVKRACHGHIGMAAIWSGYARCVHEVCNSTDNPNYEARSVLKAEESVRFNACAETWIHHVCRNDSDYPVEIFRLLGLTT